MKKYVISLSLITIFSSAVMAENSGYDVSDKPPEFQRSAEELEREYKNELNNAEEIADTLENEEALEATSEQEEAQESKWWKFW